MIPLVRHMSFMELVTAAWLIMLAQVAYALAFSWPTSPDLRTKQPSITTHNPRYQTANDRKEVALYHTVLKSFTGHGRALQALSESGRMCAVNWQDDFYLTQAEHEWSCQHVHLEMRRTNIRFILNSAQAILIPFLQTSFLGFQKHCNASSVQESGTDWLTIVSVILSVGCGLHYILYELQAVWQHRKFFKRALKQDYEKAREKIAEKVTVANHPRTEGNGEYIREGEYRKDGEAVGRARYVHVNRNAEGVIFHDASYDATKKSSWKLKVKDTIHKPLIKSDKRSPPEGDWQVDSAVGSPGSLKVPSPVKLQVDESSINNSMHWDTNRTACRAQLSLNINRLVSFLFSAMFIFTLEKAVCAMFICDSGLWNAAIWPPNGCVELGVHNKIVTCPYLTCTNFSLLGWGLDCEPVVSDRVNGSWPRHSHPHQSRCCHAGDYGEGAFGSGCY